VESSAFWDIWQHQPDGMDMSLGAAAYKEL
jgi:hypothetical protein